MDLQRQSLRDMRAARRRRRIEDFDRFEALYKAYLTLVLGGLAVWLLSGVVGDTRLHGTVLAHASQRAPAVAGAAWALAVFVGLRSGGRGGPLGLEAAEVRHVLMAPVERRLALRPPAVRQLRFGLVVGLGVGAVSGLLAYRRFGESAPEWIVCGAAAGALIAGAGLGSAMLASGRRMPRLVAAGIGFAVLGWSAADIALSVRTSPATFVGEVAVWPLSWRPLGIVGVVVSAVVAVLGLLAVGNTSIEAAERRAALVGQIRFAATLQDVRTVMVLRRQLAQERPRRRPWIALSSPLAGRGVAGTGRAQKRPPRFPVWRRGWQSLLRFPGVRVVRMVVLGALAGVAAVAAFRGTTVLVVVAGVALYVAALDALEPVSQDLDHPDRLASIPRSSGSQTLRQLAAPVVAMIPVCALGWGVAVAVTGGNATAVAVGAVIFVPAALSAVAGATISVVQGAPNPGSSYALTLPPEAVGFVSALRIGLPPGLAVIGVLPIFGARHPGPGGAAASVAPLCVGVVASCYLVGSWVHKRERMHAWFKQMSKDMTEVQKRPA